MIAGEAVRPTSRLTVGFDYANLIGVDAHPDGVTMINPDVTAHVLRRPTSEWIAITGDTRFNPAMGRGSYAELSDDDGVYAVVSMSQLLQTRPSRPSGFVGTRPEWAEPSTGERTQPRTRNRLLPVADSLPTALWRHEHRVREWLCDLRNPALHEGRRHRPRPLNRPAVRTQSTSRCRPSCERCGTTSATTATSAASSSAQRAPPSAPASTEPRPSPMRTPTPSPKGTTPATPRRGCSRPGSRHRSEGPGLLEARRGRRPGHGLRRRLYLLGEVEFIIAAEDATFFDPHVTYGMTAAFEPMQMLAKMPFQEIMRMALLGADERMSAARAREIGLVTEVVPGAELMERAEWAARVIADSPPLAIQGTMRALWTALEVSRPRPSNSPPSTPGSAPTPTPSRPGRTASHQASDRSGACAERSGTSEPTRRLRHDADASHRLRRRLTTVKRTFQ